MTFVVLLTFAIGALASVGVARAADRHRRWTLAMVERRRRRVADALRAMEHDLWDAAGERPPQPAPSRQNALPPSPAEPRRIVLRVRD